MSKARNKEPVDPRALAEAFLFDYVSAHTGEWAGRYRLGKWRGEYFKWDGRCYRHISDETVKINVTHWLQLPDSPDVKVTKTLVGNVLLNIDPLIHIGETCELNTWI